MATYDKFPANLQIYGPYIQNHVMLLPSHPGAPLDMLTKHARRGFLIAAAALLVVTACGCAGLLIEGAEAGELTAEAAAPTIAEEAAAGGIADELALDRFWPTDGVVRSFDLPLDGDIANLSANGTRYSIDLPSGIISDTHGTQLARIEGTSIYRVYPRGAHELMAEIETRLVRPIEAYRDPTALDRIRLLKTGDLVQVVRAQDGWYQFRYVDEYGVEELLWVFSPALLSRVDRKDDQNQPSVSFYMQAPKTEIIASTLDTTKKLKNDIDSLFPQK